MVDSEWPGLGPGAIAHVFGEHEPIVLRSRTIAWVHPEAIQTETEIRVVLAKEAISTGWDCPRAEVLYSERPAKDATHIAQVIGRMVRQPLAHRIATDDVLNSVTCLLPLFDRKALSSIKDELEGKGAEDGENRVGPTVVRDPKVFERNPRVAPEVLAFIETLPSITIPGTSANPLRRAKNLVRLLADSVTGRALLKDADASLTKTLNAKFDGLAAEHADEVPANVADIEWLEVHTSKVTTTGQDTGMSSRRTKTHARDIDRDTRRIINAVKEGVGKSYYAHRASQANPDVQRLNIRVEVAALIQIDGVIADVEATATHFVQKHLEKFAVAIKNTTGATRDAYRKVQEQTTTPEAITVELRANEKAATKTGDGDPLPTFAGHIYSDATGQYPARLNAWEKIVIETEIGRPSFVAWYRNPQQATPNSLRIPYQNDAGKCSSLQIDFLIVSRREDGTFAASIVDPHGDHLADAKAKLRALANFAEEYGDQFLRIQSLAMADNGELRSLDLLDADVRRAVRGFEGGKVSALYTSESGYRVRIEPCRLTCVESTARSRGARLARRVARPRRSASQTGRTVMATDELIVRDALRCGRPVVHRWGGRGASDAILGGDCARVVERGCWGGGGCVAGGRHEVVPREWRGAVKQSGPAVGTLSVEKQLAARAPVSTSGSTVRPPLMRHGSP